MVKTPHSNATVAGSIPGQGAKIPLAAQYSQKVYSKGKGCLIDAAGK